MRDGGGGGGPERSRVLCAALAAPQGRWRAALRPRRIPATRAGNQMLLSFAWKACEIASAGAGGGARRARGGACEAGCACTE